MENKERVQRVDAFNSLEIQCNVGGRDEEDDLFRVTLEEERASLVTSFNVTEDWTYTSGAKQIARLRSKRVHLSPVARPPYRLETGGLKRSP